MVTEVGWYRKPVNIGGVNASWLLASYGRIWQEETKCPRNAWVQTGNSLQMGLHRTMRASWLVAEPRILQCTTVNTAVFTVIHCSLARYLNYLARSNNAFYPMPLRWVPQGQCFFKHHRLRNFAILVRGECRCMNEYGALVEWYWQGKTEVMGGKPVTVPLCPPQISHGLTWDGTLVSAVRGRQLTPWASAMFVCQQLQTWRRCETMIV
jgi:hypothetical protein